MNIKTILTILAIALSVTAIVYVSYLIFFEKNSMDSGENGEEVPEIIEVNACKELGCPASTIYVGSKNSDRYYTCDCHYAKSINPENIICFDSDASALEQDYVKSLC
jgi:ABC-type antimicrobial peptide transport system permease subunit